MRRSPEQVRKRTESRGLPSALILPLPAGRNNDQGRFQVTFTGSQPGNCGFVVQPTIAEGDDIFSTIAAHIGQQPNMFFHQRKRIKVLRLQSFILLSFSIFSASVINRYRLGRTT
jgi:hypothetical protein